MTGARSFIPGPLTELPAEVEIEQALCGTLLANCRRYELVGDILTAQHFADPLTARIFEDIARHVRAGKHVDATSLRSTYQREGILDDVGGPAYLPKLITLLVPANTLVPYAKIIVDRWVRREVMRVAQEATARAASLNDDDPADAIASALATDLIAVAEGGERRGAINAADAAGDVLRAADEAARNGSRAPGILTGIAALDEVIGGLAPGSNTIVGARTGVGKTTLALVTALAAARSGVGTAIFSLEMPASDIAQCLLSAITEIPRPRIRAGRLDQPEWDALVAARDEMSNLDIRIDDTERLTIEQVRLRARSMSRKRPVGLILIDHISLLSPPAGMEKTNPTIWLEANSKAIKALAKELRVPVLVLTQLNRNLENREDKRPVVSDIRWSGSVEQDADAIVLIHRPEVHLADREPERRPDDTDERHHQRIAGWRAALDAVAGKAELIVAKNRAGPKGTVMVSFDASCGRITGLNTDRGP